MCIFIWRNQRFVWKFESLKVSTAVLHKNRDLRSSEFIYVNSSLHLTHHPVRVDQAQAQNPRTHPTSLHVLTPTGPLCRVTEPSDLTRFLVSSLNIDTFFLSFWQRTSMKIHRGFKRDVFSFRRSTNASTDEMTNRCCKQFLYILKSGTEQSNTL